MLGALGSNFLHLGKVGARPLAQSATLAARQVGAASPARLVACPVATTATQHLLERAPSSATDLFAACNGSISHGGQSAGLGPSGAPGDDSCSETEAQLQALEAQLGPISRGPTLGPPQPLVIVISGPSGVGKDAVIKRLAELRPDLYFVVTATSRSMRPKEVHGVDYLFVSKEQFEEWIEAGELLEHAVVYGEYKGIPRQQVRDALGRGTDVVLRIDVQGAATVRSLLPGMVSIFLVAETEAELVSRLLARKTESVDKLNLRVSTARTELARLSEFDYVVVNRDGHLDETVSHLATIINAEKARTSRRCVIPPILKPQQL